MSASKPEHDDGSRETPQTLTPLAGRAASFLRPNLTLSRAVLTAVLALGAVTGYAQGPTIAFFAESAQSVGNAFSTGSIDVSVDHGSALFTPSGLKPGQKVTAQLTITNSGSLTLRYAVSSKLIADTNGLGDQLTLVIRTGVTCTEAGFATGGSDVYGSVASPLALGAGTATPLVGNLASPNGGRTIVGGANATEELCFQVSLPTTAPNTVQGGSTTAVITVSAEPDY